MKTAIRTMLINLSGIEFFRSRSYFLELCHKGYAQGEASAKIRLNAMYHRMLRTVFFFRWAPGKYWGGPILNLLGLSLVRYFYHNMLYSLRFLGKPALYSSLQKNGIDMERGFFEPGLVQEILEFHSRNAADVSHHFEDFSELIISNTKGPQKNTTGYLALIEKILKDKKILQIGRSLTGKSFSISPYMSILHSKSEPAKVSQEDGQNTPHIDVFYPSFKIFVYLNEVTEKNGAFRYFARSQAFSLKNAMNYYKDCFNYYWLGGHKQIHPNDATSSLYKNDFEWVSANGSPGDAVFFNVQGIHRRGDFEKGQFRERLVFLVDFRQVEAPFQELAANV
jgi:hypothetical protein